MRLLTFPLSFIALCLTGQAASAASGPAHPERMPAHLLSRADGNTNMPEFIDVAQLIAPPAAVATAAAATPDKPRPTARIEDVGTAAIAAANQPHPKPIVANGSAPIASNQHIEGRAASSPAQRQQQQHQQQQQEQNKEANDVEPHDQPKPANGVRKTRTVVTNHVKTATVFDDVETSATKSNEKGAAKPQQSSTSQRQPGMLNRFGDDESDGGFSLKNSALAGVWKAGGLALISVGYFSL
ncbi:hypothetical protein GGI09_003460 [Coemansia sp. S100]|nr:hypothetical protein GGI09_003460 [Coemansia sp. S100]KAJ2108467.1 hypothetical protein GGI16_001125 [Coemansia sp. S142-1]